MKLPKKSLPILKSRTHVLKRDKKTGKVKRVLRTGAEPRVGRVAGSSGGCGS